MIPIVVSVPVLVLVAMPVPIPPMITVSLSATVPTSAMMIVARLEGVGNAVDERPLRRAADLQTVLLRWSMPIAIAVA